MNESCCPTVILYHRNSTLRSVTMDEAWHGPTFIICLQSLHCSQSIHHRCCFLFLTNLHRATYDLDEWVIWWQKANLSVTLMSDCMYLHKSWFETFCGWRWGRCRRLRVVKSLPAALIPSGRISHQVHIQVAFLTKFSSISSILWHYANLVLFQHQPAWKTEVFETNHRSAVSSG